MDYENVLLVKNEVFVYRIPPRQSNRGYRANDWGIDSPFWTGRLRVVATGKELMIKLEDRNTGELYARCPVDAYPGIAIEQVTDSSRYFVIRLMSDDGRTVFTGIGFADRSDSFDFNVALQDHFKWVRQEKEVQESETKLHSQPSLDLGFKEGQTIKLNLNTRRTEDGGPQISNTIKSRLTVSNKSTAASTGLLPPPPAPAVSRSRSGRVPNSLPPKVDRVSGDLETTHSHDESPVSNVNLLNDLFGPSEPSGEHQIQLGTTSVPWTDFQ